MTTKSAALTPRGERTRVALIDAARTIFERDGFATARITDIAEAAGTAIGSFYTYFDSKDAIFKELVRAIADDFATPLPKDIGTDPFARIQAGNRNYVTLYRRHGRILAVMQHRTFEDAELHELRQRNLRIFTERAERAIRRLQSDGRAARDVNPRFAAMALSNMVHAFCYETFSFRDTAEFDDDEIVDGLAALWSRAIGLAPGATAKPNRRARAR